MPKIAIVLLQLGGPDSPDAVEPYLFNFFSDPAIIGAPKPIRWAIAKYISKRRSPTTRGIYAHLGGKSPILELTRGQASELEREVADLGNVRAFVAMRYWHPFAQEVAAEVREWAPDEVVLIPLYPQFSTTTTGSAILDWRRAAAAVGLAAPTSAVCCYPTHDRLVAAHADLIRQTWPRREDGLRLRLLFSAHGLPKTIVEKGDPYQWQVERTARALVRALGIPDLDWRVTYQSRVTPQEWLKPDTEDEIKRAGEEGVGVVILPIAFVSEHSETLVELDIEYAEVAKEHGVPLYARVPALGTHPLFIECLGQLVRETTGTHRLRSQAGPGLCPAECRRCAHRELAV